MKRCASLNQWISRAFVNSPWRYRRRLRESAASGKCRFRFRSNSRQIPMSVIKRLLLLVVVLLAACVAYLLLWPVPISPVAWTPPAAPGLTGDYQHNDRLAGTCLLYTSDAADERS